MKRRGFTIAELVVAMVVIAIIAGLITPAFINIIERAKSGAKTETLRAMNEVVEIAEISGDDTHTMSDALNICEENGISEEKISEYGMLWDSEEKKFVEEAVKEKYKYFKIYDGKNPLPITDGKARSEYSIYLGKDLDLGLTSIEIDTGIDVGDDASLNDINYKNYGEAREVIIKLSGGTLTIDAPMDKVSKYGYADEVKIIALSADGYREYGFSNKTEYESGEVSYSKVEAKAPTFTEEGNVEHYIGSDGKFYLYENGEYVETEQSQIILQRVQYMKVKRVDSTCTETGVEEHYVDCDGNMYVKDSNSYILKTEAELSIDKKEHEYSSVNISNRIATYSCKYGCGKSVSCHAADCASIAYSGTSLPGERSGDFTLVIKISVAESLGINVTDKNGNDLQQGIKYKALWGYYGSTYSLECRKNGEISGYKGIESGEYDSISEATYTIMRRGTTLTIGIIYTIGNDTYERIYTVENFSQDKLNITVNKGTVREVYFGVVSS